MDLKAHKPILLGAVLALALVGALNFAESPDSVLLQRLVSKNKAQTRLPRGSAAPDFHLPGLDGKDMELVDLKGASSALVFVSFGCPHCKKLMIHLLEQGLPDMGHRLVFIKRGSKEAKERPADIQELESNIAAQFPVLQDTSGTVFEAYRTTGVPTTYMLDAEGRITASKSGEPKGFELVQKLVEDVLKQKGT